MKIPCSGTQDPLLQLTIGETPRPNFLAKQHRNYLLIVELGRFYRGSMISAYFITAQ
jgi:hypothetical protein